VVVVGGLSLFMTAFHFGASDSAEVRDSLKIHIADSALCMKEHKERIHDLEVDSAGTSVKLQNIENLLRDLNTEIKEMRKELRDS
jgi:hypothetical protein